jgi:hypothetical protein
VYRINVVPGMLQDDGVRGEVRKSADGRYRIAVRVELNKWLYPPESFQTETEAQLVAARMIVGQYPS